MTSMETGTAGDQVHARLLEEILLNADDDIKNADEAPEYRAEFYVRWLESERERLLAAAPAPPYSDDVHVDWHMTPGEWRQLYTDLWQHADTPYIARLIEAGKIPQPPAGTAAADGG